MAELWELVDINMQKTGATYIRGSGQPFPRGMYHVGAEIWVKRADGRLLLTLRHPDKECGNMWECTAGSYIAGEWGAEGAVRELREETGICADPAALRLLGRRARRNTIVETYLYLLPDGDVELKLQPEEVIDAKWAEYREVAEHPDMVRNIRESFALYKHILAQAQPRE